MHQNINHFKFFEVCIIVKKVVKQFLRYNRSYFNIPLITFDDSFSN